MYSTARLETNSMELQDVFTTNRPDGRVIETRRDGRRFITTTFDKKGDWITRHWADTEMDALVWHDHEVLKKVDAD